MTRGRSKFKDNSSIIRGITTFRPETSSLTRLVSLKLGGITLYCEDEIILHRAVNIVREATKDALKSHLMLPRFLIIKFVVEKIGVTIEDRFFGAILGMMLRLGDVTSIPCLTKNNKIRRIYIHSSNISLFGEKLHAVEILLKKKGELNIATVRNICFPDHGWGTWTSSQQMLQHLAYMGKAVLKDEATFVWPEKVESAIRPRV